MKTGLKSLFQLSWHRCTWELKHRKTLYATLGSQVLSMRHIHIMKTLLVAVVLLTFFHGIICLDGMLEKITSGFKMVGQYLGLDYASEVAQLVSQAFSKRTGRENERSDMGSNIFSGFLRVMGFDSKKIGAIAVNAIIFVAQLISSSLAKRSPPQLSDARELKEENPLEWILNNSYVSEMLEHARTMDLSAGVIEHVKENSLDEETDCIQLLMCKTSPFIKGMQRAFRERNEEQKIGKDALFEYMPTMEDIAVSGEECEQKHPYCFVHY